MKKLQVTGEVWKEGNMFTAYCPKLDVAGCGQTPEQAKENLLEVITIHLEETREMGTLNEFLEQAGFDLSGDEDVVIGLRKEIVELDAMQVPLELAS